MLRRYERYIPAVGLGVTQIVGYGALMYAFGVLLPLMADSLSLPLSSVFGVLSVGLFLGGLAAPLAGRLVDRFGGRWVMTLGSVAAGLGVMSFSLVTGPVGLLLAVLLTEGAGMFVLYNVAFAAVTRLDVDLPAKTSISIITLFGGVASTIFWPLTLAMSNQIGWQASWLVLGATVLLVCVPIHWFALAGSLRETQEDDPAQQPDWPPLTGRMRGRALVWMVVSFVCSGYIGGALMALWVNNAQELGHTAAAVAIAGAIIGPFKTVGRGFEMLVGRNLHPMATYGLSLGLMGVGFAVLLGFGFSFVGILVFAALYGMGNGIQTIARGTLPLALFGARDYGARLGWISFVTLSINASAPFVFAFIAERFGGWWSFAIMAVCLIAAALAHFLIPNPRKTQNDSFENRRMSALSRN